jgi:glycosyltransferase involved in cell wall biosynthesis
VVTVRWRPESAKTWSEDVQSERIKIHKIPSLSFHNLATHEPRRDVAGRIMKKLRTLLVRLLRLLYPTDDAQYWGYSLVPYCRRLISGERIQLIIATGQPFMVNYWAARLSAATGIPLINDFRDAWNEGPIRKYLLSRRRSIARQRYAIANSRYVTVTSEGFKTRLLEYFDIKNPEKVRVLYNGYDEDDFRASRSSGRNARFHISYAGGMSFGRERCLRVVLKQLVGLCESGQIDPARLEINLCGVSKEQVGDAYGELAGQGCLRLHGNVAPSAAIEQLTGSDLALLFNSRLFPSALSSKLFEIMRSGRPVLVVTPEGDIAEICHRFGIKTFAEDQESGIAEYLRDMYSEWSSGRNMGRGFTWEDLAPFSYDSQTDCLEQLIKDCVALRPSARS